MPLCTEGNKQSLLKTDKYPIPMNNNKYHTAVGRLLFAATFCAAGLQAATAQTRTELSLKTWQFSRDSLNYKSVTIPHDWAISGPFDKRHDLQYVAIEQNGETEKTEKSGRSGALPWIGRGFYKTTVDVSKPYAQAVLCFDGAMSEPVVYVNGRYAGRWAYGYNAFRLDITKLLHSGKNEISVSLNNREESSRWYPGGGLYRPVTLELLPEVSIDPWQSVFSTVSVGDGMAEARTETRLRGGKEAAGLTVVAILNDSQGHAAASAKGLTDADGGFTGTLKVKNARLWSPESPYLYTLVTSVYRKGQLIDRTERRVGLRTVSVSKENGFQLNGQTRKIKGVCLHHDLGPLGAAVNKSALIRQIKMMKRMGCDAIRTAHNMPSTMQMEVCDSLGVMVMAETFDMWKYPKCKNGYAVFFDEWAERDITNLILNHRNHPSIIMWSIGNEIPEQWSGEGVEIAKRLQDLCHRLDPTRPVTQGMDKAEEALKSGFAQVMDVPGFNYRTYKYQKNIEQLPQGFLLGSETASTVSSRGVYKFPVVMSDTLTYSDGQCSSYDVQYCSWSNLPEDDWVWQDYMPWVIGEFVWTGYDYLGEPTPYDEYWPSRSSYFGICDLAGLPKDRYWLYRSHWLKDSHTVHLLPHWTWPGMEGQSIPVYCYTDGVEAELFVNGKSHGKFRKDPIQKLDRYRIRWNDVKYEPGELKVVAYDNGGNVIGTDVVRTAGRPVSISLSAEVSDDSKPLTLCADGNDMAFITVSLADKDGNFCPTADDEMEFEVSGNGVFQAACNGDATSLEPFTEPRMKLFSGKLVVIVRATTEAGNITLTVRDKRLGIEKSIALKSE